MDKNTWTAEAINAAMQIAQAKEADAEKMMHRALRAAGWKHTSSNPACVCLWQKTIEINGEQVRVMVPEGVAIQFVEIELTAELDDGTPEAWRDS